MSKHYVGVADPKLVYVLLEDRAEFDKIGLNAEEHAKNERGGQCISKTIKADGMTVVFQHWIRQPIYEDDGDIGAGLLARDPDMSDYEPERN